MVHCDYISNTFNSNYMYDWAETNMRHYILSYSLIAYCLMSVFNFLLNNFSKFLSYACFSSPLSSLLALLMKFI